MKLVVASTGGSGVGYLLRLFYQLSDVEGQTEWIPSENFFKVYETEFNKDSSDLSKGDIEKVLMETYKDEFKNDKKEFRHKIIIQDYRNIAASSSSGSTHYDGMVIIPCSMKTLASIASGLSSNLIERAADVSLKERRKLILVPRETPYSLVHIENMKKITLAGGIVMPASPGFYNNPRRIEDLYDFMVDRVFMHLGINKRVMRPWNSD